jgi:hypothetical protein
MQGIRSSKPRAGSRSGAGNGGRRYYGAPHFSRLFSFEAERYNRPLRARDQAACYGIDPDTFFPTSEEEAGPALAFCGACRIRQTCLAWALKNGERYGVWGGLTEQQRRRVVRFVA